MPSCSVQVVLRITRMAGATAWVRECCDVLRLVGNVKIAAIDRDQSQPAIMRVRMLAWRCQRLTSKRLERDGTSPLQWPGQPAAFNASWDTGENPAVRAFV